MTNAQRKRVMAEKVRIASREVRNGDKKLVVMNFDVSIDSRKELAGFHIVPQAELDFMKRHCMDTKLSFMEATIEDGESRNVLEPTAPNSGAPSWSVMFQSVYEMMTDKEYEELVSQNRKKEVPIETYAKAMMVA